MTGNGQFPTDSAGLGSFGEEELGACRKAFADFLKLPASQPLHALLDINLLPPAVLPRTAGSEDAARAGNLAQRQRGAQILAEQVYFLAGGVSAVRAFRRVPWGDVWQDRLPEQPTGGLTDE